MYEQRSYRHTERFHHPTDGCRSCVCTDGAVNCQRKPCPFATCSHPITQACCQTCEGMSATVGAEASASASPSLSGLDAISPPAGCLHEGRERANGETWDDLSDPCSTCACRGGSVRCERKRCPPANCKHPVQRQCCMSCDGALTEKDVPKFWVVFKKVHL